MIEKYNKTILSNGITVVSESIPYLRSVSLGVWVNAGSRNEGKHNNGISHFLEHLAFKGTKKRSAREIAMEMDSIGGQVDAFTSKEYTCYSAKILDDHLLTAVDLLSDVLINSTYDQEEIDKEKQVILEEIKMVEDNPHDLIHDLFYQSVWGEHPLGAPIQGTYEIIKNINRDSIIEYLNQEYFSENIVIGAAGNFKLETLIPMLEEHFSQLKLKGKKRVFSSSPEINSTLLIKKKDLEQVHFCLGTKGLKSNDPERYTAYLLNIILGGGMSSRLFQKIREDRGLVYSIYSFNASYLQGGILGVCTGMSADSLPIALELIAKELKLFKENLVDESETRRAKEQLKGNLMLSLESSGSRMNQMARQEICFGRYFSIDETFREIEKVTRENILDLANKLIRKEYFNLTILGPCDDKNISLEMLEC